MRSAILSLILLFSVGCTSAAKTNIPTTTVTTPLNWGEDEIQEFLKELPQSTQSPKDLHDDYTAMLSKKQRAVREQVEKRRREFKQNEAKARQDFLEKQRQQPTDVTKARTLYFAEERQARAKFEAELSAAQKQFETAMHAHQTEFNEAYRAFAKRAAEKPRAEKAVTGDEFKQLDKVPARPLGTED